MIDYPHSLARLLYAAQRIAQANDKALLNDVLIGQAKQAFDNDDFPKAEAHLLQAQRPDLAVKLYKDNGRCSPCFLRSSPAWLDY